MNKLKVTLSFITAAMLSSPAFIHAEENYPEQYDLRNHGIISTPYDQGSQTNCWAFSFLGSADTRLISVPGYERLSEWYLSYSAYNGTHQFRSDNPEQIAYSGTPHIASALLTSWRGMALFSDVPDYYTEDQIMRYDFSHNSVPEYIINDISYITPWIAKKEKPDKEKIKALLTGHNSVSVTCSMNESDRVFNRETSALFNSSPEYNCKNDPFYHSVLITGWDDTFSRENFSEHSRPQNDGAWIVKNSYGTSWGEDGFFYISYEDTSLQEAVSVTSAEKNPYSGIYQYDHFGWTTSLPSDYVNFLYGTHVRSSRQGYMSNIFQASRHEDVSAVSFYTIEEGAEYEITVRTGLEDNSKPDSGTIVSSVSGTENIPGYHTVNLDIPAEVQPGEYFSVSVKISNPSSVFTIPIEACIFTSSKTEDGSRINISNITSINRKVHTGESFISPDGENWYDICVRSNRYTEELSTILLHSENSEASSGYVPLPPYPEDEQPVSMACGNVCVKAFTVAHKDLLALSAPDRDLNSDGMVNTGDLITLMRSVINSEYLPSADINHDGLTDSADILIFKRLFFD